MFIWFYRTYFVFWGNEILAPVSLFLFNQILFELATELQTMNQKLSPHVYLDAGPDAE